MDRGKIESQINQLKEAMMALGQSIHNRSDAGSEPGGYGYSESTGENVTEGDFHEI